MAPSQLPPDLLRLAQLHRRRQQRIAKRLRDQLRLFWRFVDARDPQVSWSRVSARAVATMTAAQAEATRGADAYVATSLRLLGADPDPVGEVSARALAGVAADGRDLSGLLGYPAFEASAFVDQGMNADQALAIGGRHLDRIAVTEAQDAARVATGLAITNDRKASGWIRMVTPPSCSRCLILAGQWYEYNRGFRRHNLCDCVHVPAAEVIEPQSPRALFESMSDAELRKAGWSAADISAIRDHGADISQVTNAHRELRSVTVAGQQLQATGHGATRRGLAGKRLSAGKGKRAVRLTPASLYSESERLGWSREELVRQLTRHGYIVGG